MEEISIIDNPSFIPTSQGTKPAYRSANFNLLFSVPYWLPRTSFLAFDKKKKALEDFPKKCLLIVLKFGALIKKLMV